MEEKNSKKEITLDDLARLVVERFDDVDKRFDKIEMKLENIEADLNKKVDVFVHKDLEYRVEKLEKHTGLAVA